MIKIVNGKVFYAPGGISNIRDSTREKAELFEGPGGLQIIEYSRAGGVRWSTVGSRAERKGKL